MKEGDNKNECTEKTSVNHLVNLHNFHDVPIHTLCITDRHG